MSHQPHSSESEFTGDCRRIEKLARELDALLINGDRPSLAPKEIAQRLITEPFRVLVIGEFSRGKSTFVNALVGEKILPSSVRPTTAVITVIKSGQGRSARIVWRDRSRAHEEIELPVGAGAKALEQFITTKNQEPDKIAKVEITIPIPHIGLPFELVDTPGVNDIDTQREDITYGYLSRADAAILLLDLQQPLSASENRFLVDRVLGSDLRKLMFVVNKIDQEPPDKLKRALDYVRSRLDTVEQCRGAPILPVASKLALQGKIEGTTEAIVTSRFTEFETALTGFLHQASGAGRVRTACLRLSRIVGDLESADRMVLRAIEGEVAASKAALAKSLDDTKYLELTLETCRKEINLAIRDFKDDTQRRINAHLQGLRKTSKTATQADGFPTEEHVNTLRGILNRGQRDLVQLPAEAAREVAERLLQKSALSTRRLGFDVAQTSAVDLEMQPSTDDHSGVLAGLFGAVGGIVGAFLLGPIGAIPLSLLIGGLLSRSSNSQPSAATLDGQIRQAFDRMAAEAGNALDQCAAKLQATLESEIVTPRQHLIVQQRAASQELAAVDQMQDGQRATRVQAIRARIAEAMRIRMEFEQIGGAK